MRHTIRPEEKVRTTVIEPNRECDEAARGQPGNDNGHGKPEPVGQVDE